MALNWLLAVLQVVLVSQRCIVRSEFTVLADRGHSIAGRLDYFGEAKRRPTVVLVAGAGPSDRNYSTAYDVSQPDSARGNGAFADIAAMLIQSGYGVVRFDEVGTGQSSGSYSAVATTESLASDVAALVRAIRRRSDIDPRRIVLLGHSEGSAIAMLVAWNDPMVAGVISLAGPARSGRRIMNDQFEWLMNNDADLRKVPFAERRQLLEAESVEREARELWYRHFLRYDPITAAKEVHSPVLLIHGLRDWKVAPENVFELRAALAASARDVKVATFHSLGHELVEDSSRNLPRLSPAILMTISSWLRARWPASVGACSAFKLD